MNEELKERLYGQGKKVFEATRRFENAKASLESIKGAARAGIREARASAREKPLNEADTDALVACDGGCIKAAAAHADAKAELEAIKTDSANLLAEASLVCAEVAAMSRISQ